MYGILIIHYIVLFMPRNIKSLLPFIPICKSCEEDFVFQQDGAVCHTATMVKH